MFKKWAVYIGVVGVLLGQLSVNRVEYRELADILEPGFSPDKIALGSTDITYLLDSESRRLVRLSNGNLVYSGGFGSEMDAFFDPTDITVNNLQVSVSDRSGQRLVNFDSRLNFINEIGFSGLENEFRYPQLIAADPWGDLLVYFETALVIGRFGTNDLIPQLHIDLEGQSGTANCVEDMKVNARGDMALLLPCHRQVRLFNRFGRLNQVVPVELEAPAFLLNLNKTFLVMDVNGNWQSLNDRKSGIVESLPVNDLEILDTAVYNNLIYLLTAERIIIVEFE